jgi:hypothetical protein
MKMGYELGWIPLGWELRLGFCDDGDEPSGSITVTLLWPADYQVCKEVPVPVSEVI